MILVTGTKRSGTSMWMQILRAGGFPIIGKDFSSTWGDSIRDANPHGFWESAFRQGVFYATNPHPQTGEFLHPDKVARHAVKVFVPGLVRTEFGFVSHVIATMRPWREYVASVNRLYAMEEAWLREQPDAEARLERARAMRPNYPAEVEWWFEHYDMIRDVATRRYPFHWVTYHRVLADPEREIQRVFRWLGGGDVASAVAAVQPSTRTQHDTPEPGTCAVDARTIAAMDALYATCHEDRPLSAELVDEMNAIHADMEARFGVLSRDRQRDAQPR
ncbi:MAG: hypothetical protein EP330_24795 [Deltaproteobacteria bacterium]|nr:MAG: hypothetical protein EP330_24795 [Deltaproteobacteria bacterium]